MRTRKIDIAPKELRALNLLMMNEFFLINPINIRTVGWILDHDLICQRALY